MGGRDSGGSRVGPVAVAVVAHLVKGVAVGRRRGARVVVDRGLHLLEQGIHLLQVVLCAQVGDRGEVVVLGHGVVADGCRQQMGWLRRIVRGYAATAATSLQGHQRTADLVVGCRVDVAALERAEEVVEQVQVAARRAVAAVATDISAHVVLGSSLVVMAVLRMVVSSRGRRSVVVLGLLVMVAVVVAANEAVAAGIQGRREVHAAAVGLLLGIVAGMATGLMRLVKGGRICADLSVVVVVARGCFGTLETGLIRHNHQRRPQIRGDGANRAHRDRDGDRELTGVRAVRRAETAGGVLAGTRRKDRVIGMGLDVLLEILGPLKGLAAEIALVRLEGHMDADVGSDMVTLHGGGAALVPLARQVEVVGALAADMAFADVVLGG